MDILTLRLQALAAATKSRFETIERAILGMGKIPIGPTPPANPKVNDLWVDTN